MRRKVLRVALPLLVIALLAPAVPAAAVSHPPPRPAPSAVAWSPCPEDPSAECGTLTVPVDWSRPGGPTVDLALARRKATDPAARIGSLVINPGGPGGSGVDAVLYDLLGLSAELTARFDVVGFDPRGVARSNPVVCSLDLFVRHPDPFPQNQAEFDALLAANRRLREDCRARTGPVFDHLDTRSVARDMDALRAALGEQRLTYYGASYGTLIGQTYAELFPHRVRALALDSVMDHSLGTKAFLRSQAAAAQDSFDEFVAWCERTESCALHGQDVRAVWADLLTRSDNGEFPLPQEPGDPWVPASANDLISEAFSGFYVPSWTYLANFLATLQAGGTPAAGSAAAPYARLRSPAAAQAEDSRTIEFPAFIFCQDHHLPVRDHREYAALLRDSTRVAPDMRWSPLAVAVTAVCLGHPTPIANPQHRLRAPGPLPPLLLGGTLHDPATPYGWALSTAHQLGRKGVLLTYEGWGHPMYFRSECTTGAFDRYLISLTLPAPGTRCPAVPPADVLTRRSLPAAPPPLPPGPIPGLPGWAVPS